MHHPHGHASASHHPHIEALRTRHSMLERQIREEQSAPSGDDLRLRELKLKKLMLKDEISQHERRTG